MNDRELTQEEIDLAPEWATNYYVDSAGDILFESDDNYQWVIVGETYDVFSQLSNGMRPDSKPIPRKKIDITEREFSDSEIGQVWCVDGQIQLNMVDGSRPALLSEDDIDAMKAQLVALRGGNHE